MTSIQMDELGRDSNAEPRRHRCLQDLMSLRGVVTDDVHCQPSAMSPRSRGFLDDLYRMVFAAVG